MENSTAKKYLDFIVDNEPGGLRCSRCGCRHFDTDKTLPIPNGVRRYKKCRHCGLQKITLERDRN